MKKALIVVDMQNDFITGVLGNSECQAIVKNVARRIQKAREDGYNIFFTMDTHNNNYLDTQEGKNLPIPHCILGTEGWRLVPDVLRFSEPGEIVTKTTFGSITLANLLLKEDYEEIELVGVCTDICIINNAMLIKTFLPEVTVVVNASCCAGVTPDSHKTALEAMKSCQIKIKYD